MPRPQNHPWPSVSCANIWGHPSFPHLIYLDIGTIITKPNRLPNAHCCRSRVHQPPNRLGYKHFVSHSAR